MIDLRNYATVEIVEELCKREKIVVHDLPDDDYDFRIANRTYSGPAKILVIREEQE